MRSFRLFITIVIDFNRPDSRPHWNERYERDVFDIRAVCSDQLEHAKENVRFVLYFSLIGQIVFLKVHQYAQFSTTVKRPIFSYLISVLQLILYSGKLYASRGDLYHFILGLSRNLSSNQNDYKN